MVVKVASSVLENFNENSENEAGVKSFKRSHRKTPSKLGLQRKNSLLGGSCPSPTSKTPLATSSLANINNASPLKHRTQIILPRTPIKREISFQAPPDNKEDVRIKYENDSFFESPPSVSSQRSSCSPSPRGSPYSCRSSRSPGEEFLQQSGTPNCSNGRSINGVDDDREDSCSGRLASQGNGHQKPPPVSRRNARERNRVKQVSMGFALLRQHVPLVNRKKKLSKVETLRGAVDYIRGLEALLQEHPHPIPNQCQLKGHHPQTYIPDQGSNQFIQVQINQPAQHPSTGGGHQTNYTLQNVARTGPVSLQHGGGTEGILTPPASFYEERLHQFQMSSSCLEPQILKVPKLEDQYHSAPVYSTNVYNIPTVSYVKSYDGSPTTVEAISSHQNSKEHLSVISQGGVQQEFPLLSKDAGEMDLLEALAWWQQNS